ncbi:MAG: phage scaffolding protein [Lachnospiraceae bacterium]|nr:phage scaffolding protein [Lachnospiraceae bacterium]MBP3477587.1 phage scaffolding protein [Lachnospiraceae bacterium]
MTLKEILKTQGLTDEQIEKIIGEMKQNNIFTASEENLDTRYGKLKTDHEGVTKQLTEANALIEQLKKGTTDNEALQGKITTYETTVADLKTQLEQEKLNSSIKIALLSAGCKDVDYVTFKLKEKGDLSLDESDKVKGMDDKIAALKTQFPAQFESAKDNQIEVNQLPKGYDRSGTEEPKTLAEALKQQYEKVTE